MSDTIKAKTANLASKKSHKQNRNKTNVSIIQTGQKKIQPNRKKKPKKIKRTKQPVLTKEALMNMFPVSSGANHRQSEQNFLAPLIPPPEPPASLLGFIPQKTSNPVANVSSSAYNKPYYQTNSSTQPTVSSEHSQPAYSTNNAYSVPFYKLPSSQSWQSTGGSVNDNVTGTVARNFQTAYAMTKAAGSNFSYSSSGSNNKRPSQKYQPWVKRDSLKRPAPYSGGRGQDLLQKMGWNPGQGLGKRKDGTLEPHMPEIRVGKRGFDIAQKGQTQTIQVRAKQDQPGRWKPQVASIKLVTEGKNPISILEEYCSKRKCPAPRYETIKDEGPIHAKNYVFKVTINGIDYSSEKGSHVKKEAKQVAAKACLEKLGILPA